jgi:chitodextrinase
MNFTTPYNTSDYFFTKEQDYIQFNTPLQNTYFEMKVVITTYDFYTEAQNSRSLNYKIPVYKNKASFLLGEIIDRSMPRMQEINLRSLFQYKAADVEMIIKEIDYATESIISTNNIGPIKFLSGFIPELVQNNCAFLDVYHVNRRATPSSYAFINMILTPGMHNFKVFKNNIEVDSFNITIISSNIVSRALKLSDYAVIEGDIIECRMVNNPMVVKSFYVFPPSFYSNYIAFEDEYRLRTVMEFTGQYSFSADFVSKINKIQKGSLEFTRKISSKTDLLLTIDTGWVLQEEETIIESLSFSKRAWLIIGENQGIELVPNAKKFKKFDPTTALYSYNLEFIVNAVNEKPLRVLMDQPLVIVEVDDIPPSKPLNLTARNTTMNTTTLSWDRSTDSAGVLSYDVYKDNVYLASTPNLSFIPTSLSSGNEFTFYVKAKDARGNMSEASNAITITTLEAQDSIPPSQPTNLLASNITDSSLKLTWTLSTDATGVSIYNIYKDLIKIGEVIPWLNGTIEYNVSGLNPNSLYTFQVTAQDSAGNISEYSNAVQAQTLQTTSIRIKDSSVYNDPCGSPIDNLWLDNNNGLYYTTSSGSTLYYGGGYVYTTQEQYNSYQWETVSIENGVMSYGGSVFSPCAPF